MASSLFVDDNMRPLQDPSGLRPNGLVANIISCTMSASTQELTIPRTKVNFEKCQEVRLSTGAQAALFAFDIAGQGANYTGITNMIYLPQNWVEYCRIDGTDVSVYVLQGGSAGTFQLAVLG